jgi:hypothetical protein
MKNLVVKACIALVVALAVQVVLAKDPDISKLPPAAKKEGLTFDKDIKPLIENSCLKCHGAEKPKSKYRVDSREAFIKGGESDEAAVVPGKSEKVLSFILLPTWWKTWKCRPPTNATNTRK